ncbi:DUF2306 domain-containing protein [Chryseobacterium gallinarum]|uniref:DUF2306 domain-containing protein n=1 Tax=Chryseobacterium gallinarum TaxID=1324352 RepID=UPI00202562B8|nr:DUF2306 domain-containing protein [Chryseobacterium gallinarum]MCL8536437.1 DUF2306 domain-containing protein [Chryseobacterium gallinarum]
MKKLLFIIICILALLIGTYPLIYVFVDHKNTFLGSKSLDIIQNQIWKTAFFVHIIFGGISLFIGWRQFGSTFRNKYVKLHRIIGRIYAAAVVISSVSAIYMGIYANGGIISSAGFISLGFVWLITTLAGIFHIRKGDVVKHRQFMIYSYACTFAAVTLRLWYPLLENITNDPGSSYLAVAWLCWLPNLLVAYCINKKT